MGDKNQEKIRKHHKQVGTAKQKKLNQAVSRLVKFEINRADIKAKIEAERQFVIMAAVVFLGGLGLLIVLLSFLVGAILYGQL